MQEPKCSGAGCEPILVVKGFLKFYMVLRAGCESVAGKFSSSALIKAHCHE